MVFDAAIISAMKTAIQRTTPGTEGPLSHVGCHDEWEETLDMLRGPTVHAQAVKEACTRPRVLITDKRKGHEAANWDLG
jgi:hypothetical protein